MNKIIQYKTFLSNSSIVLISSIIVNIINYVFHLGIARLLSVQNFGMFQTIINLVSMLTIFVIIIRLQFTKLFVKLIKSKKNHSLGFFVYRVKGTILTTGLMLSIVILLTNNLIPRLFGPIKFWHVMIIIILSTLTFMLAINIALMRASLSFVKIMINANTHSALKVIIILPLLLLGYKLPGALWGLVVTYILVYILSNYQVKKYLARKNMNATKVQYSPLIKESFHTLIGFLGLTSFISTDLILIQKFLPNEAGLYAGLVLFGKVIIFTTSPISNVLFPSIISIKKKQKTKNLFNLSLLLVFILGAGVLTIYTLFPHQTMALALSNSYAQVSYLLPKYALYIFIYSIVYLTVNGFIALGEFFPSFLVFIGAVIQIIGIIFFHRDLNMIINVSLITVSIFGLLTTQYYLSKRNHLSLKGIKQ